jgi:UDP-glucose:(glucosyl)LPS alpha-1,2-glucosyltransferase
MVLGLVLPSYEPFEPSRGALAIIVRQLALELSGRGERAVVVGPAPARPWSHGVEVSLVPPASLAHRAVGRLSPRVSAAVRQQARYQRLVIGRLAACDQVVVMNDIDLALAITRAAATPTWVFAQNEIEPGTASSAEVGALAGFLACSPSIRSWLLERYPVDPDRVRLVPNGVDLELFHRRARPTSSGLTGVFVGRIDPNKGIIELLEAVAEARRRGVAITLLVAGAISPWGLPPEDHQQFVRRFEAALVAAGAHYLGAVDRSATAQLMGTADLIFVPSVSHEPFGLVAVEALASGAAVVLSDRGALPWIGGQAALVVEPTAGALADAVERLAADPALGERLGRLGPDRAREFEWSRSTDCLLEALDGAGPTLVG